MSQDNDGGAPIEQSAERLAGIDEKLTEILDAIGHRDRPDDGSISARRWQMPIYQHLSHLSDSMHVLRNIAHVLTGLVEELRRTLTQSQAISVDNSEAIGRVSDVVDRIERKTEEFEDLLGRAARTKPFLMRDLYWIETEGFEVLLIVCAIGEAAYFLIGHDALVQSMLFRGMAWLCPNPLVWGLGWAALAAGGGVSFLSRRLSLRKVSACCFFTYFLLIGGLPIIFSSGAALGTYHHLLFGAVAAWIVSREPSNAT